MTLQNKGRCRPEGTALQGQQRKKQVPGCTSLDARDRRDDRYARETAGTDLWVYAMRSGAGVWNAGQCFRAFAYILAFSLLRPRWTDALRLICHMGRPVSSTLGGGSWVCWLFMTTAPFSMQAFRIVNVASAEGRCNYTLV